MSVISDLMGVEAERELSAYIYERTGDFLVPPERVCELVSEVILAGILECRCRRAIEQESEE